MGKGVFYQMAKDLRTAQYQILFKGIGYAMISGTGVALLLALAGIPFGGGRSVRYYAVTLIIGAGGMMGAVIAAFEQGINKKDMDSLKEQSYRWNAIMIFPSIFCWIWRGVKGIVLDFIAGWREGGKK